MDPLSITTGVLSLVDTGIKAIQTFQSLAAKYSLADLTIVSIRTECSSIRLALSQIKGIIAREPSLRDATATGESGDEMWEEYTVALDACSLTFNILSDRLTKLKIDDVDEYNATTAKTKIKAVMNSEEMACLVQNIRGQAQALTLLLQVFQTASTARTQVLRQERNSVILQNVSENARSLIGSIRRSKTISSEFSIQSSVIGDEEFDFDDEVVNSRAYRRIVARHRARNGGSVNDDEVERNEDVPTGELDDGSEDNGPHDTELDSERRPEIAERDSLWPDSHPAEREDGEEDEIDTDAARNPYPPDQPSWENPRAAPNPPKSSHLDDEGSYGQVILPTSYKDTERAQVLEDFRSRVEDWKNHDPDNFGELVLWGKYKIVAHKRTWTFQAYLFENIFICCRKAKVPAGETPKRPLGLFFRKKVNKETEPDPDPDSGPLRLMGRVFMKNIIGFVQRTDVDGMHTLCVVWKGDPSSEEFTITYEMEEEMLRWYSEFKRLKEKTDALIAEEDQRLRANGKRGLPMVTEILNAVAEVEAGMRDDDIEEDVTGEEGEQMRQGQTIWL